MARKKKQPTPEQFWDESGQLRFVVVETFNGEQHRGFWTGAPHESAFIGLPGKPDKRGITPNLKRRVMNGAYPVTPTNVFDPMRSLESERDSLVRENDELRRVVIQAIEAPRRAGRAGREAAKTTIAGNQAKRDAEIIDAANKVLRDHPKLPRQNLTAAVMRKVHCSEPTIRRTLQRHDYVPTKNKNLAR